MHAVSKESPDDLEAIIRRHAELTPGKRAAAVIAIRYEKWAEAAKTLESLSESRNNAGALDPLLLVPVLVRLGRIDEARHWLDEGERWMRSHAPQDADLEQLLVNARSSLSMVDASRDGNF